MTELTSGEEGLGEIAKGSEVRSREGQEAAMKAGFFPLPMNQVKRNFLALGLGAQDATLTN